MHGLTDADCDRILSSFSLIAELDARDCETKRGCDDERISSARLQLMLAHPALAQLRSLSLPVEGPIDFDVLERLHQLSFLSHLHIAGWSPPKPSPLLWSALLTLPALTSLSTALILIEPCLNEVLVAAQLALPPILHLRLERAVFLPGRFEQLFGRLPALSFLKPLRLLTISPAALAHRPSMVPQPIDSLIELLQQSTELHVTIFVVRPAFGSFVCPADAAALYPDEPPETRTQLPQLADRLRVQPDELEFIRGVCHEDP